MSKAEQGLLQRMDALEAKQVSSKPEELIDTSSVAATLLESALRSIDLRYGPCAWQGCKHSSFVEVVTRLTRDYAQKHTGMNIVQVGYCVDYFLGKMTMELKDNIARFDVLDPFDQDSPASNKTCVSSTHRARNRGTPEQVRRHAEAYAAKVSNETKIAAKVVTQNNYAYGEKSIDILILDLTNEARTGTIRSTLKTWMKRVKVGGLVIGHSLAVLRPFELSRGVTVSWNAEPLSPIEVTSTREAVHAFIQKDKADLKVLLAGDTTWYIKKRKLRLSDLFKP